MNPQAIHTQEDIEDMVLRVLSDGVAKTTGDIAAALKAELSRRLPIRRTLQKPQMAVMSDAIPDGDEG